MHRGVKVDPSIQRIPAFLHPDYPAPDKTAARSETTLAAV
jgi:hypothetical protein